MDCFRNGQQNIQEICFGLAHTEALCTFREGEEGYNTPSLISEGLQGRPVKNSAQKIQDTLTSWGRNTWKCTSAGVLPQEEGVHLFDSTGSNLLSTQVK